MPIWWPQVRRGSRAVGPRSTGRYLWCSAGSGGSHHARLSFGVPRGVHGSAGRSGREAVRPAGNRPQAECLSKRFLGHPERSRAYHDDTMPRGLPSVHFLRASGIRIPPDIRGVALPPTVSGEAGIETESKRQGLWVSENSAKGQGNRQAVVVCRASAHGCVERALMKMTGRRAWKQAGAGGIDEGMDGQHSYPHIHNVLVSPPLDPPLVTTTTAYLSLNTVLTMGSTSLSSLSGRIGS